METMKFCQSCGMPMAGPEAIYGKNEDGTTSEDYCSYCYENGKFTFQGTMREMIDMCVPMMVKENENISTAQAQEMCDGLFPTLKRWKA